MAQEFCASCKARVEEGAVRCASCGADLYLPGAFLQVVGWVVMAVSLIPFAISEVTTTEKDFSPLIIGGVVLAAGIVLVFIGRAKSKGAPPTVLRDVGSPAPAEKA